MRRDVQEQPLQTWQQFLDYCEGATVAPAEVFIHILGSRDNPDRLHCELPKPLGHYARDMAVFCYLVHIIRDLPADAQHTDQLLTVPEDLLLQHDLDKGRLKDALSLGKLEPVVTLAVDLAERARSFRSSALCRQQEMQAHLSQDAYELLGSLFATYESIHDAVLDDRTALLKIWATKPVRQEAAKTV